MRRRWEVSNRNNFRCRRSGTNKQNCHRGNLHSAKPVSSHCSVLNFLPRMKNLFVTKRLQTSRIYSQVRKWTTSNWITPEYIVFGVQICSHLDAPRWILSGTRQLDFFSPAFEENLVKKLWLKYGKTSVYTTQTFKF